MLTTVPVTLEELQFELWFLSDMLDNSEDLDEDAIKKLNADIYDIMQRIENHDYETEKLMDTVVFDGICKHKTATGNPRLARFALGDGDDRRVNITMDREMCKDIKPNRVYRIIIEEL